MRLKSLDGIIAKVHPFSADLSTAQYVRCLAQHLLSHQHTPVLAAKVREVIYTYSLLRQLSLTAMQRPEGSSRGVLEELSKLQVTPPVQVYSHWCFNRLCY